MAENKGEIKYALKLLKSIRVKSCFGTEHDAFYELTDNIEHKIKVLNKKLRRENGRKCKTKLDKKTS